VLTKGVVFDELPHAKGNPFRNNLTRLSGVSVLTVMTTPDKAYRWWYRDPTTKIMFKGTFAKIGIKNLKWINYASVTDKTDEQRQQMLNDTHRRFAGLAEPKKGPSSPASARVHAVAQVGDALP
jgi:putative NADPH-quinone reductase